MLVPDNHTAWVIQGSDSKSFQWGFPAVVAHCALHSVPRMVRAQGKQVGGGCHNFLELNRRRNETPTSPPPLSTSDNILLSFSLAYIRSHSLPGLPEGLSTSSFGFESPPKCRSGGKHPPLSSSRKVCYPTAAPVFAVAGIEPNADDVPPQGPIPRRERVRSSRILMCVWRSRRPSNRHSVPTGGTY